MSAVVRVLVFLVWLTGQATGTCVAASLGVSPIRIDLPPNGDSEVIRLRNNGDAAALVQLSAVRWADDVDAAEAAPEILAVPPVVEVPPGGEQIIRLGLRRAHASNVEAAYRFLITEVPRKTGGDPGTLLFAVRLSLPLFVTPTDSRPIAVWTLKHSAEGGYQLQVTNTGSAHVRITDLSVGGLLIVEDSATYVLAGESKSWPLGQALSELPDVVEVRAETNHGPIVARVRPERR